MAFITIPICYIEIEEIEEESASNLKIKPRKEEKYGEVSINTQQICSYMATYEDKHTLVNLSNGQTFECTHDIELFDDVLATVESTIDLSTILNEN